MGLIFIKGGGTDPHREKTTNEKIKQRWKKTTRKENLMLCLGPYKVRVEHVCARVLT